MEAGQVGDSPGIEDGKGVETGGLETGADGLAAVAVLGLCDGGTCSAQ